MDTTEFIWFEGKFVRWDEAQVHVLTHTMHYGGGVFEGIRAYETERGAAIFRLKEHMDRLFYSAGAIRMAVPYTQDELARASVELIRRNKLAHGYIRPLVYFAYGKMGLNPAGAPVQASISCWPWGKYLPYEAVDIKTSKYIRIHPKSSVADAKICGHYVNSILAVQELQGTKYHEALFLDYQGNIAEGPGENFFMVKGGKLFTPPLGAILAGITRKTIIDVAKDFNITVSEVAIRPEEALKADEAFFTGTAAEVTPIRSIDDNVLGGGKVGPLTQKLKDIYQEIVHGRNAKYERYLTYVNG